jgi:hypothetical protein
MSLLINDILMKAQGLVHFYNISHCMFRNKLNDRRVVPLTHACNALHESMRTYTLHKKERKKEKKKTHTHNLKSQI